VTGLESTLLLESKLRRLVLLKLNTVLLAESRIARFIMIVVTVFHHVVVLILVLSALSTLLRLRKIIELRLVELLQLGLFF